MPFARGGCTLTRQLAFVRRRRAFVGPRHLPRSLCRRGGAGSVIGLSSANQRLARGPLGRSALARRVAYRTCAARARLRIAGACCVRRSCAACVTMMTGKEPGSALARRAAGGSALADVMEVRAGGARPYGACGADATLLVHPPASQNGPRTPRDKTETKIHGDNSCSASACKLLTARASSRRPRLTRMRTASARLHSTAARNTF